jgi:exodeoxyribonuclease-5
VSITLNSCQEKAVDAFVQFMADKTQTELVIKGHAGTGKTTLVAHILDNLPKYQKSAEAMGVKLFDFDEVEVTATTRKAANVIAQSLNVEPRTIHSYLGLIVRNDYQTGETFISPAKHSEDKQNVLLFIDEASFIDPQLLKYIRKFTNSCKVIYTGDPYQLLPVNISTSPVFDGNIPTVALTTVMRHDGAIDDLSSHWRDTVITQEFSSAPLDNKKVIHLPGNEYQAMIDDCFLHPDYQPDVSAKIVAWTNGRVIEYNKYINSVRGINEDYPIGETLITNTPILGTPGNSKEAVLYGADSKVRILNKEPAIAYGVEGYQLRLKKCSIFAPTDRYQQKVLMKQFASQKKWSEYFNVKERWADLRPAYAATVHKSQGSTYEKVFIDLNDIGRCNNANDLSRLLYVAVSRASKQVILSGELPEKYSGALNEKFAIA